ncbi:MAG: hypothetical protein PHW04_06080 [Candidatus Wallbacteria bacterium]|nr:hypothetical protein [Candidatus Wallbacteria bacterium]
MQRLQNRKASIYLAVLIMLSIIVSFALTFTYMVNNERHMGQLQRNLMVAKYIAQTGIDKMIIKLGELAEAPLIKADGSINEQKLSLLSYDRAGDFSLVYEGEEILPGGKVRVVATIQNPRENAFKCGLETEDELPLELQVYKSTEDPSTHVKIPPQSWLGGWAGELKMESKGEYEGMTYHLEVVKGIKALDLSPCATLHTLFVQSKKDETLKSGRFVLSNWQFSGEQYEAFNKVLQKLIGESKELIDKASGCDLQEMVAVIKNFVMANNDIEQRDAAEKLIMTLSPWGFIRSNGKLNVYLPFFEVDDVINYFVLNPYFQRPEVGYPGCYSRLHDLYMAKYTRYEGDVIKHYYRLAPYILQKQYPREIPDKYTRYSTYTYWPTQHPDSFYAENYKRYLEESRSCSCQMIPKDVNMVGSSKEPILLNGLTYISGNLSMEGVVKGKGTLVVKSGNLKLTGDVRYADDKTSLVVFVTDGCVTLERGASIDFQGSLYSKASIKGGKLMKISGNLVVEDLDHEQDGSSSPQMPEDLQVNYQPEIRNIMADNLVITISRAELMRRKL